MGDTICAEITTWVLAGQARYVEDSLKLAAKRYGHTATLVDTTPYSIRWRAEMVTLALRGPAGEPFRGVLICWLAEQDALIRHGVDVHLEITWRGPAAEVAARKLPL